VEQLGVLQRLRERKREGGGTYIRVEKRVRIMHIANTCPRNALRE
jgi:hypothetical protein